MQDFDDVGGNSSFKQRFGGYPREFSLYFYFYFIYLVLYCELSQNEGLSVLGYDLYFGFGYRFYFEILLVEIQLCVIECHDFSCSGSLISCLMYVWDIEKSLCIDLL